MLCLFRNKTNKPVVIQGNIFNENKHYKCCRSGADLERMWDEHERKEQDEKSRMGGRTKIDIMYGSGVAGR